VSVHGLPSGHWRAVWRDGDGRKHSCAFPTREEAERYDAKVKRAKVRARAQSAMHTVEPTWPQAVYFARAESGPIKIGASTEPEVRLAALRNGSAEMLRAERVVWAPVELEQVLHALLARHRLHGEWFAPEPLVVLTMALPDEALRALGALPVDYVETVVTEVA
jgi:hypothetical protein